MPLQQIVNRERPVPLPRLDPLRRREFWAEYGWMTRTLVLHDASEEGAPERSYTLGFENVARPYPHALRWDDLDLLGRYVASADRDQPHPSWPVLLLARLVLPTPTFLSAGPRRWRGWHGGGLASSPRRG